MSVRILGLGTSIPAYCITQQQAFDQAKDYCGGTEKQQKALKRLYERSEISSRATAVEIAPPAHFFPKPRTDEDFGPTTGDRMRQYENEIVDLALQACDKAIADARANANVGSFDLSSIRNLVTVTCTGFSSPGFDIALIDRLRLNRDVSRNQIGFMGCHGALNGLRVANALQRNTSGLTLLCAAEICSIHFHYGWSPDSLLANSLFADGAGALILGDIEAESPSCQLPESVETGQKQQQQNQKQNHEHKQWQVKSSASYVVPNTLDAMSWKIGDHGFTMTISSGVPDLIKLNLRDWLDKWLQTLNLKIADIKAWAIHPGGARILDAVGVSLDLSDSDLRFSREVLQRSGNMSSATVLFVLDTVREQLGCVPTVLLAFGPGMTIEAAYCSPI